MEANNIPFFTEGGTTLGAIRNKGIIPWDDDIDVGIFEKDRRKLLNLRPIFLKCGYIIVKSWFGYKIYDKKNKLIEGFNYAYPFLDIFLFKKIKDRYVYSSKEVRDTWPKSYYKENEFLPFKKVPFGDFTIPVVNKPIKYLDRMYGNDWKTHGYREYDHQKEEEIKPVKVKLTKKELLPAQPTSVKNRTCMKSTNLSFLRKSSGKCNSSVYKGCAPKIAGNKLPVFVINCDIHKDRLKKFRKYAKKAGLSACREVCVNGKSFDKPLLCDMIKKGFVSKNADITPIELSITYSHINVWQRFVDSCKEYALVIEDDAEVHKDFKKMLNKTLKALHTKKKKFDVLYLWNGNWANSISSTRKVLDVSDKITVIQEKTSFNAGTVAYIITRKLAQKLLRNAYPVKDAVDIYLADQSLAKGGKVFSIKMTYNKKKECYLSPFFQGTDWICGGAEGTGQTTQDYSAKTIKKLKC